MLSLSPQQKYFVFNGHADMRKGFDSLAGLVRNNLGRDPISGDVYVFFNRPRTHVKLLCWERDGYAIYYKRLEKGTYELPHSSKGDSLQITAQTLSLILQGIILSSVKRKKRFDFAA
jgi:transposase